MLVKLYTLIRIPLPKPLQVSAVQNLRGVDNF